MQLEKNQLFFSLRSTANLLARISHCRRSRPHLKLPDISRIKVTDPEVASRQLERWCIEHKRKELRAGFRKLLKEHPGSRSLLNRSLDWLMRCGQFKEALTLALPRSQAGPDWARIELCLRWCEELARKLRSFSRISGLGPDPSLFLYSRHSHGALILLQVGW
jgi:hypothetical protein